MDHDHEASLNHSILLIEMMSCFEISDQASPRHIDSTWHFVVLAFSVEDVV